MARSVIPVINASCKGVTSAYQPDEMKLPTASGGVSSGILPLPTRLRSLSFDAVHLAIHPRGPASGISALLQQAAGYSGEGE